MSFSFAEKQVEGGSQYDRSGFATSDTQVERLSPGALYKVVTHPIPQPPLLKSGKRSKRKPKFTQFFPLYKDKSPKFYAAQCTHYGLPTTRKREYTKKTLLEAMERARKLPGGAVTEFCRTAAHPGHRRAPKGRLYEGRCRVARRFLGQVSCAAGASQGALRAVQGAG